MTIPTPWTMSLSEWSSFLRDDLRSVDILVYNEGDDWRAWGNKVVTVCTALAGAPTTEGYGDWRDWAMAVIGAIGG